MNKSWVWLPVINFLLAAFFGLILRFAFVVELPWMDYRNFMHAHSHLAMLGWVFPILFLFLFNAFSKPDPKTSKRINLFFWLMQGAILAMVISFSLSGYSSFSGAFSGFLGIISIILLWFLFRSYQGSSNLSHKFLKAAIFFYLISSFSVWALPVLVNVGKAGTIPYYLTIQFFLHFQFNGWFVFSVFALILKDLEEKDVIFSKNLGNWFFWLLFISCIMTFALALSWATPMLPVFLLNSLGVLVQLVALILLTRIVLLKWSDFFKSYSGFPKYLFIFSMIAFYLKVMVQFMVWIPAVATAAYTVRNFVIGFFHLVFLGVVTLFVFAYGMEKKYFWRKEKLARIGLWVFTLGVILSEIIIFSQGILFWGNMGFLPFYYKSLFLASCLLPIGLLILIVGHKKAFQELF
jgi:hypothetical protein